MDRRDQSTKKPPKKGLEVYVERSLFVDHETQAPTAIAQIHTKNRPRTWLQKLLDPSWHKEVRRIKSKIAQGGNAKELILAGAKKLLNHGHKYDSIRLLYEFSYYREAADILRAMGANADAARLYVKAKRWEQAEICFTVLQDRVNAARCAQAAGKYAKAAPVFEEFQDWHSAARCQRRLGDWRRAAYNFASAGRSLESIRCWHEWLRIENNKPSSQQESLTADELRSIVKLVAESKCDDGLMRVLESHDWTFMLVIGLVKRGRLSTAAEVYGPRFRELSNKLCEGSLSHPELVDSFLELCQSVGDLRGYATLLEQAHRLHEAVECYEQIGDVDSAYNCALKCEWWEKITAFKAQKTTSIETSNITNRNTPGKIPTEPSFSLASVQKNSGVSLSLMSTPKTVALDSRLFSLETQSNEIAPAFVESKFFMDLSREDRRRLWEIGNIITCKASDTIVAVGESPSSTFTVIDGEVAVYRVEGDTERLVDVIKPGQNFGESWLLVDQKSRVRIAATTDCHIHCIERTGFNKLTASGAPQNTHMLSRMAQAVCTHLLGSIAGGRH